jgi:hypothetical protein
MALHSSRDSFQKALKNHNVFPLPIAYNRIRIVLGIQKIFCKYVYIGAEYIIKMYVCVYIWLEASQQMQIIFWSEYLAKIL